MNILYIHGFGTHFDETSPKVSVLKTLGRVTGLDIDYTKPICEIFESITNHIKSNGITLLVGTSMGGFFSAYCSANLKIPFVALNPVIYPRLTLSKYIGSGIDYTGKHYTLTSEIVENYPENISTNGCGLIMLEKGDELIDAEHSFKFLSPFYNVIISENGSHRFEGLQEKLPEIQTFYNEHTQ